MKDIVRVALVQIRPLGSIRENTRKGLAACEKAKRNGAHIALFPEMWNCGYRIPQDLAELNRLAVPADGGFVRTFAGLACELEMAIGITFLEESAPAPKNSFCLFDRILTATFLVNPALPYVGISREFARSIFLCCGQCPFSGDHHAQQDEQQGFRGSFIAPLRFHTWNLS